LYVVGSEHELEVYNEVAALIPDLHQGLVRRSPVKYGIDIDDRLEPNEKLYGPRRA
jgi:hypothetical protein